VSPLVREFLKADGTIGVPMKWLICSVVLMSVFALGMLWGTDLPLGVPGEWTWSRIPITTASQLEFVLGLITGGIAGLVYFLFCQVGCRRMEVAQNYERMGWLCGLVIAGFFFLISLQETPVYKYRLSKAPFVLYYPASSGYYFDAREIQSLTGYLSGYESELSKGDVLHFGTHPPGLSLLHYSLIQLCRNIPALQKVLLQTQLISVAEAAEVIQLQDASFTELDASALWLATLVTQLLAVLTIIPIYGMARWFGSRPVSWFVAALWPTVPALAVFLPKSDAIYPLLAMLYLWCWIEGLQKSSWWHCLLAGLIAWLGLFFSLAMLPILLIGGATAIVLLLTHLANAQSESVDGTQTRGNAGQSGLCWAAALVGFLLPIALIWLCFDANLLNIWLWNYQNHAGFYAQYSRTFWKWLLVNPIEMLIAIGAPIVVLALFSARDCWRSGRRNVRLFFSVCFVVWGLLWISGKNMGEAARLWLLLMPLVLLLTTPLLARISGPAVTNEQHLTGPSTDPQQPLATSFLLILVIQILVSLLTVTRITGFDMLNV